MLEVGGFFSAILIGVALGLIGAGGSILTMPVLVYLMNVPPVKATSYSLFVVGLTALIGSIQYMRQGLVRYDAAVLFSVPAFGGVFLSRAFILPSLPEELFRVGGFVLTKGIGVMILFAILMLMASVSMIRKQKEGTGDGGLLSNRIVIFAEGFVVGILTGLVGAGGGFLIIPALVVLTGMPMKGAVGTSLLIIAVKSLLGFTGDISYMQIEWSFLMKFSAFAVSGIFIGTYLSRFIPGSKLKPAFGWFVLLMGVYILIREIASGSS